MPQGVKAEMYIVRESVSSLSRLQAISKMSEQDDDAPELEHAEEVLKVVLVADDQASEILEPGEEALDFPTSPVSSKRSSVLGFGSFPVGPVGGDHFDPEGLKLLVQRIAVISLVADDPVGKVGHKQSFERNPDQGHFMRRSAGHVQGDRKTSSVCHCHDLGPFPPLSFTNSRPPFFAGAKVPSMKASLKSRPPRSRKSSAKLLRISSNNPESDHFWNQRWQVWYGGYLSGMSFQGAPVRNTHSIPLSTSRGFLAGRPRCSARTSRDGISFSNFCHCTSLMSIPHKLYTI